jgi:DNA-binding NarL/FixJ family response regulator
MVLSASMPNTEIFEAGTLDEAIQRAPDMLDVMLLDIKMPGLNGVEGIALLKRRWPLVPVLMLSSLDEPETVRHALARGATAFISKADTADKIVALINLVLHGELSVSDSQPKDNDPLLHLTPRQCEVLGLLCQGLSNKLIARQLALSENTVRGHVQSILSFLHVSSRSEAALTARQRGLVN